MSLLAAHAGTRRKVRIERNHPSNPGLNGFALFARVLHVTGTHVHLWSGDGLSQREEPDPVPLGDITKVQMATPYLTRTMDGESSCLVFISEPPLGLV